MGLEKVIAFSDLWPPPQLMANIKRWSLIFSTSLSDILPSNRGEGIAGSLHTLSNDFHHFHRNFKRDSSHWFSLCLYETTESDFQCKWNRKKTEKWQGARKFFSFFLQREKEINSKQRKYSLNIIMLLQNWRVAKFIHNFKNIWRTKIIDE